MVRPENRSVAAGLIVRLAMPVAVGLILTASCNSPQAGLPPTAPPINSSQSPSVPTSSPAANGARTPISSLPATAPSSDSPPSNLGFPFPRGASYVFSGPHSFNGLLYPANWGGMDFWMTCASGPDCYDGGQDGAEIAAAHDGIVEVGPSGCSVLEIYHVKDSSIAPQSWEPDGWATIYDHVVNLDAVVSGARVHRGDVIARTNIDASGSADLTFCPPGSPSLYCPTASLPPSERTGINCTAHVHMSLYKGVGLPRVGCTSNCGFNPGNSNPNEYGLDQTPALPRLCIGGYEIHRGQSPYDGSLFRNGQTIPVLLHD